MPKVISVGNIAMGGTGKTPFTIMLAQHYMSAGEKVAILSLGYKGKLGYGTHVICDGETVFHTPPMSADEPYMMAITLKNAIVITGKNRTASYNLAMERYNPTVFILDDGFQHRQMKRDLDIVLLDHKNPISTGFPFPFGYLREFPSALKRADVIVFTRAASQNIPEKVRRYCEGKQVFFCRNEYDSFVFGGENLSLDVLAGKSVYLMSGIAKPKQFSEQISGFGAKVLCHRVYRDHYAYSAADIEGILAESERFGADYVVTTQKDMVKIPAEYAARFMYPRLNVIFISDQPATNGSGC